MARTERSGPSHVIGTADAR